jgi:hypothetical protein
MSKSEDLSTCLETRIETRIETYDKYVLSYLPAVISAEFNVLCLFLQRLRQQAALFPQRRCAYNASGHPDLQCKVVSEYKKEFNH